MTPRSLRRLSRLLDAVASRLGRLAALLDVLAEPEPAAMCVPPGGCQFCGAPAGRVMCHGCPGVERGIA